MYRLGDADLDGNVDGQDFIAWNAHKFTNIAEWCAGDFNADGVVDGLDFIEWNANKFTSAVMLRPPIVPNVDTSITVANVDRSASATAMLPTRTELPVVVRHDLAISAIYGQRRAEIKTVRSVHDHIAGALGWRGEN